MIWRVLVALPTDTAPSVPLTVPAISAANAAPGVYTWLAVTVGLTTAVAFASAARLAVERDPKATASATVALVLYPMAVDELPPAMAEEPAAKACCALAWELTPIAVAYCAPATVLLPTDTESAALA